MSRVYDAENRMTSETQASNYVAGSYTYDGDGRRVRRTVNDVETWQVYGMDGELVAEYVQNGAVTSPQKEYGYRNGQLLITADAPTSSAARTNFALAANGGIASASSVLSTSYPAASVNNGDRKGLNWGDGGGWRDAEPGNTFPDWVQVDFSGSKTIDEVDVFTVQDNYSSPSAPTETMTFSLYGQSGYDVQYWNGSSWVTVSGGYVTGNNKVWKKITFAPLTTSKIRVLTNAAVDGYSRMVELEAWGAEARTNVAAAADGGSASASSELSSSFPASSVNNGDRKGLNWGSGGGWRDAEPGNTFPDWVEVDFNGSQTIDEVDVFTVQDNYASPSEPTETQTFSLYGLTGYEVQYWNPDTSAWTTVTGGSITSNSKVWRKINFSPITTSKIRVLMNAAVDGYSRLTEIEAWTTVSGSSATATINWLVTDQLGTPRMLFDQSGSLATTKRHDYAPFGEELFNGARTTAMGYAASDGVRRKFTSKERDNETGLDYFGARYYASTMGRFTSADPLLSSGREEEPQSWNRYSYVLNNPLRLIDPSGLYEFDASVSEEQRKKFNAGLTQGKENLQKIAKTYGTDSKEYKQAKRALDAYGAEGVKNGVTIRAAEGNDGATQVAGAGPKDIRVTFDSASFSSENFSEGIGHEGSHVADGADWVKSGYADKANPSAYQYEVDGYTVQSLMAEANNPNGSNSVRLPYFKEPGKNPYLPERATIWKSEWKGADRATLAAFRGNVDRILSRPEAAGGYNLTPTSTTRALRKGSAFPR